MTFRYRTSDTGQTRLCTLPVEEFIRRFLQHVLPKGLVKVRYYGLLAPGRRPQLAVLRRQLGCSPVPQAPPAHAPGPAPALADRPAGPTPPDPVVRCPACGQVMRRQVVLPVQGGQPP